MAEIPSVSGAESAPTSSAGSEATVTPDVGSNVTSAIESGEFDVVQTAERDWDGVSTEGDADELAAHLTGGKYKTVRDLANGYRELRKLGGKSDEAIPETYDLTPLGKHGLPVYTETEHPDVYSKHVDRLKAGKFTQDQIDIGAEIVSEITREVTSKLGPIPDMEQEMSTLREKWGDETDSKLRTVGDWAKKNLDPDVVSALSRYANGALLIERLMNAGKGNGRGPVPINTASAQRAAVTAEDINLEIDKLMSHPEHGTNSATGRAISNKLDRLFQALEKTRK